MEKKNKEPFVVTSVDCQVWYIDEDGLPQAVDCNSKKVDFSIEKMAAAEKYIDMLRRKWENFIPDKEDLHD